MTSPYTQLAYSHLATVLSAAGLGGYLLARPKGSLQHKFIGKIYLCLMFATALITLSMSAQVGPTLFGHFGFIHLFSVQVLYGVPAAYFAARQGDIKKHRSLMLGLYIGGIVLAGAFTLAPGRMLNTWIFA